MAGNDKEKAIIIEKGGLKKLIELLHSGRVSSKRNSALALANLATSKTGREVIAQEGGTKALVDLLSSPESEGFLEEVALAVANLAFNNDNRVSMAADGCIQALIKLLESESRDVAKNASQALANLAYNDEINERITSEGGISVLMGLLIIGDPAAEEAARALANLARNMTSKSVIVEHGGINALIKLLPDTNVNCKRNAALALANLAHSEFTVDNMKPYPLTSVVEGFPNVVSPSRNHSMYTICSLLSLCTH